MNLFPIFFLVLSQFVTSHVTFAEIKNSACPVRLRAVIDMGSGTTKLIVGEVETCKDASRLRRMVGSPEDRPVALEAGKNDRGEISEEAMEAALHTLNELRDVATQTAKKNGFKEFDLAVVGTHALRTAGNRGQFLKKVQNAGFELRALTQDEEAEAGFDAVRSSALPAACKKEALLVWDVGGGSTQFVRAAKRKPTILKFDLGAESFRKKLLGRFDPAPAPGCPADPESPNPLGKENLAAARALVEKEARVKASKIYSEGACVVGIGGVHNKAVAAQIEKNWRHVGPCACVGIAGCLPTSGGYNKKELECLAENFAQKSDCSPELKGPYAKTAAGNLAMILGFMDQLKIDKVFTMPINMGHHFVVDSKRLKFKTVKVN